MTFSLIYWEKQTSQIQNDSIKNQTSTLKKRRKYISEYDKIEQFANFSSHIVKNINKKSTRNDLESPQKGALPKASLPTSEMRDDSSTHPKRNMYSNMEEKIAGTKEFMSKEKEIFFYLR